MARATWCRCVAALARFITAGSPPPVDPLGPVAQNPDDVRDTACKLVQSSSSCSTSTGPVQSPSGPNLSFLGVLMWLVVAAVVIALLVFAIRALAGRRLSRRRLDASLDDVDPDDDALAGMVVIDRSREPGGWRQEAEAHRAAGRIRDALRCRYRAVVGDLARRGLLDEIPGRTTGEERSQLRNTASNAVPFFREAADLFDAAWYGNAIVTLSDDDRFQRLESDVLTNAPALSHRVPRAYEATAS
jgi:hypothetical protein